MSTCTENPQSRRGEAIEGSANRGFPSTTGNTRQFAQIPPADLVGTTYTNEINPLPMA